MEKGKQMYKLAVNKYRRETGKSSLTIKAVVICEIIEVEREPFMQPHLMPFNWGSLM